MLYRIPTLWQHCVTKQDLLILCHKEQEICELTLDAKDLALRHSYKPVLR